MTDYLLKVRSDERYLDRLLQNYGYPAVIVDMVLSYLDWGNLVKVYYSLGNVKEGKEVSSMMKKYLIANHQRSLLHTLDPSTRPKICTYTDIKYYAAAMQVVKKRKINLQEIPYFAQQRLISRTTGVELLLAYLSEYGKRWQKETILVNNKLVTTRNIYLPKFAQKPDKKYNMLMELRSYGIADLLNIRRNRLVARGDAQVEEKLYRYEMQLKSVQHVTDIQLRGFIIRFCLQTVDISPEVYPQVIEEGKYIRKKIKKYQQK